MHFLCNQKNVSLLDDVVKKSAKEAVDVDHVVMHVKAKHDDGTTQMDAILRAIEAQEKSNGHDDTPPVLGYIAGEAPEGKLLEKWTEKLKSSGLQLCDITDVLGNIFAVKEADELTNVKKAAYLTASAMEQFVVPELEKVIDEEKKVTHFSLMKDTQKAILEPARIKVKLKADNDSGSVITCALGSRYNSYCTNVARTFLIDSDATQIKAYQVLLKAHEAAVGALKPGNKANAVYKAAYAVVEKEAPELIPNLKKSAGTSIGLEYRESGLNLNKTNERILKAGMVLNVSLSFQCMRSEAMGWHYALLLADTVIVTVNGCEVGTSLSRKTLEDVVYDFDDGEEEEDERPQVKVEAKRTEALYSKASLRSGNHETPFLVATLSEIETVNLERVALEQKNFDMANVFKDLKCGVFQIHSFPSTSIDDIKEWFDTTNIKYYDSRLNMNSRAIPETITDSASLVESVEEEERKRRMMKVFRKSGVRPSSSALKRLK
ncbi:hypothetical protein L6452_19294 [Arctium lappa]|uniref:Uncharacterized protein n=1 Tax=Arctium lappa TaxID=4217 RepID=A0ACB9B8J5_ARCLA|nr:hypothetical protein L6452_19294 [Arctium lappa]